MTPISSITDQLQRGGQIDTRALVMQAADALLADGIRPTVANVRARTGRGSASTINAALKDWWQDLGQRMARAQISPEIPAPLLEAADALWAAALKQADEALATYRADADKSVAEAHAGARDALLARDEAQAKLQDSLDSFRALENVRLELERRLTAESERRQMAEARIAQAQAEADRRERELRDRIEGIETLMKHERERSDGMESRLSLEVSEQKTAREQSETRHRRDTEVWREEKNRLSHQVQQAHQRSAELQGRLSTLEVQLADARDRQAGLHTEKENLVARQGVLEAAGASAQKIEEALRGELNALRETVRLIEADRDVLKRHLEEARRALLEAGEASNREKTSV